MHFACNVVHKGNASSPQRQNIQQCADEAPLSVTCGSSGSAAQWANEQTLLQHKLFSPCIDRLGCVYDGGTCCAFADAAT